MSLANEELAKREARHTETDLMAAGKKAVSFLRHARRVPSHILPTYDAAGGSIWHEVSTFADEMMNRLFSRDIRGLDVVFGEMQGAGSHRPTVRRILPLVEPDEPEEETVEEAEERHAAEQKQQEEEDRWAPYEPYEPLDPYEAVEPFAAYAPPEPPEFEWDFYPSSRVVLQRLLPTTVRLRLFQCFLEAAVTEQIARMASMRSASENAEEMIKDLTVQYNRSRQGQITTELAEILGGSAALE